MTQGQIVRGSNFGEIIYNLAKREDVKNIVEIGTWYGLGSTKCVIDGIIESKENKNFISVELYPEMYDTAKNNLKDYLTYVNILNGSIIDYDDMFWFDFEENKKKFAFEKSWYNNDLEKIKNCKNVLSEMPEYIDLLILDGGEFSTYPEWHKLKDRVKIVVLDDTNVFKCFGIVEELLKDENYQSLIIVKDDRNGFCIFENKKYVK